jgi:hypothetical protein
LREPQARDQARKAERYQKVGCEFLSHRLVGLDTAVDPAICDHFPAVHPRLDRFHAGNWTAIRPGTIPDLGRDGTHPSPGNVFLLPSGIPNHEVTGLGVLGHLPVVDGTTRSDPLAQLVEVLSLPIDLKHVNLNHETFPAEMSARRDAISSPGCQRPPQLAST